MKHQIFRKPRIAFVTRLLLIVVFLGCPAISPSALAANSQPASSSVGTLTPPVSQETPAFRTWLSSAPDSFSAEHTIRAGENLTAIAKKYGVTPDLLRIVNGVSDKKLTAGAKLKIPTRKLSLVVDKSQNRMILKGGEEVLKIYVVSTGKNNSTPIGNFAVTNKLENPTWYKEPGVVIKPGDPANGLGTRWIGISKKSYGIHGTNEPEKLGTQCTAGCIRMKNEEVEELYRFIPPGTEVTIVD